MQKINEGVYRFQDEIFPSHRILFGRLRSGQQPRTLLITCSDSRVVPSLVTQSDPGDLFVLRNAGNLVPHHGVDGTSDDRAAAATIEYAIDVLKVRNAIICGHSHCGAMQAAMQPSQLHRLPAMRRHLATLNIEYCLAELDRDGIEDPTQRLQAVVEENVLVQMANLATHPTVALAVKERRLAIHGWVYHFESGRVETYSPQHAAFIPITRAEGDHSATVKAAA
ncbi:MULTISPECIES: carbonic anhydrase [Rhodopirellula]|uniref:carbonic anhydrase n=1 Tax=Rhodopirellula europaea 6C TaxID=1263867 RepID=M2B2H8_9BACT|nr:carbonic anhydrase [Rhodopirellula europaea]EMB16409.1 carbonate dehydratase [Rhodopirellula europaea 6C]